MRGVVLGVPALDQHRLTGVHALQPTRRRVHKRPGHEQDQDQREEGRQERGMGAGTDHEAADTTLGLGWTGAALPDGSASVWHDFRTVVITQSHLRPRP